MGNVSKYIRISATARGQANSEVLLLSLNLTDNDYLRIYRITSASKDPFLWWLLLLKCYLHAAIFLLTVIRSLIFFQIYVHDFFAFGLDGSGNFNPLQFPSVSNSSTPILHLTWPITILILKWTYKIDFSHLNFRRCGRLQAQLYSYKYTHESPIVP